MDPKIAGLRPKVPPKYFERPPALQTQTSDSEKLLQAGAAKVSNCGKALIVIGVVLAAATVVSAFYFRACPSYTPTKLLILAIGGGVVSITIITVGSCTKTRPSVVLGNPAVDSPSTTRNIEPEKPEEEEEEEEEEKPVKQDMATQTTPQKANQESKTSNTSKNPNLNMSDDDLVVWLGKGENWKILVKDNNRRGVIRKVNAISGGPKAELTNTLVLFLKTLGKENSEKWVKGNESFLRSVGGFLPTGLLNNIKPGKWNTYFDTL